MRSERLVLLALGAALALAFAVVRLSDPDPVRDLRLTGFDYLQRLDPRPFRPVPVRVVDIDDAALAALGQWPWPRSRMAALTDRLAEAGAAVVVHDILYAEPDRLSSGGRDNDAELALALARTTSVLGTALSTDGEAGPVPVAAGVVEIGNAPASALPPAPALTPVLPELAAAASGIGVISVGADGGGPVRRLPLVWAGPDGPVPSLSLEALRVAGGETTLTLWGAGNLEGALEGVSLGDLFMPTTPSGELWLRYRAEDPGLYLPARTVLEAPVSEWAPLAEGHIVLIGTSAAGLLDIRTTALGETVPGVSIHAQAIEQMLLGTHLSRSDVTAGFELLALLAVVAVVTLAVAYSGPGVALGLGAASAAGLAAASWFLFRNGTLFDAAFPLLAGFLTFALLSAYRLVVVDRERRLIRRSFSHYVAPEVLYVLERSGYRLAPGGEAREVTVLFADLRGFTPLSESLPPGDLVALLNELFEAFGAEIMAERGTIDKFIGDAVMAFWNAPVAVPDHPARAVAAALRMRAALGRINAERPQYAPLRLAIGLATGPASVGNIGSRNRFNYSVVGETVNLAARAEEACRVVGAEMLVTDAVAAEAGELASLDAGWLSLKGLSGRVRLHAVVGGPDVARDATFAELRKLHAELVSLLADGRPLPPDRLAEARAVAEALEPALADFYDALPGRAEDYRGAGAPPSKRFSST